MLYELFSWLKSGEIVPLFSHQMLSNSALKKEKEVALSKRRELRAEVYAARLTGVVNDASECLESHDDFVSFITSCCDELGDSNEYNLFLLAINFLLRRDLGKLPNRINENKIISLFRVLLKDNKEESLNFYHKNKSNFKNYNQVNCMISAEIYADQAIDKTLERLARFTFQLRAQKSMLSLASLCKEFYEDTEEFAAILLLFLQRGLSIVEIIQTNLLQNFMLYHANCLDSPDNPIDQLYALLFKFPEAQALVVEAGKIQSEDRTFLCTDSDEKGTFARAITGALCEKNTLHRVEIPLLSQEFTSTTENFEALYQLFGVRFLSEALIWHSQRGDAVWQIALHYTLNQDTIMTIQLPELINSFAISKSASMLYTLSSLLDDLTIEKLVERQDGAVCHLLKYVPRLLTSLGEGNLIQYIERLLSEDEQVLDIFSQLLALFVAFRDVGNKAGAVVVYNSILDLAMVHPEFLNESHLIKILRKFSEKKTILLNRCARLQFQLDDCVALHLSKGMLTSERYHEIIDKWDSCSRQVELLNEIMPLTGISPSDKYKLFTHLACAYFSTYPTTFFLNDFIQAIEVTPVLLADSVTEYEQLLIELLITVDDDVMRREIIVKLEQQDVKKIQWMFNNYGDECVLNRAIKQGNIGLINTLKSKIALSRMTINQAVMIAAEAQQWAVVDYFFKSIAYQLSQRVFKNILNLAAAAGDLVAVQMCMDSINRLHKKNMLEAFMLAVVNGREQIVRFFCLLETGMPSTAVLAEAYKIAIQSDRMEIIDYIGNLAEHAQLISIGERELVHAAIRDKLPIIQQLCNLKVNAPQQLAIEKACMRAIEYGHWPIVEYLFSLPVNAPGQKVIDLSIFNVVVSRDFKVLQQLCHLPTRRPSQTAIEHALQQAIKLQDVDAVYYLCSLDTTPPRHVFLENMLLSMVKYRQLSSKQLSIVNYISSLLNPTTLDQVTQFAAKHGHLAVVRQCCQLNSPKWNVIRSAIRKASTNAHKDVVDYLNSLLEPLPKPHDILESPNESGRLRGLNKKNSLSLSALGINGMFSSRRLAFRQLSNDELIEQQSLNSSLHVGKR